LNLKLNLKPCPLRFLNLNWLESNNIDFGTSTMTMMAETAEPRRFIPRRFLVEGAGPLKSIAVMMYCHFSVALLCLNVAFDLFVFGLPAFFFHKLGLLPDKLYMTITTAIINWTTPVVFFMPMVVSGSKLYCNDVALLAECKYKDSLLLSNHGSVSL